MPHSLNTPSLRLAAAAILLAAATGLVAGRTWQAHLDHRGFFYEPVVYSFYNARLHARFVSDPPRPTVSPASLAVDEWLHNDRHPLRTVPLILGSPRLLAHPAGHLATALPMFGIWLFLLGWTVFRRTGHEGYALACMALFCAIPGMFNAEKGLGANWPDLPAAFLAGGALLCLINAGGGRSAAWLAGFALLAAGAALGRYVAAGYVFVMAAPVLALRLHDRWRRDRSWLHAVVLPLLGVGVLIGAAAGWFLAAHFRANMAFYGSFGYGMQRGIGPAALGTLNILKSFLREPHLVLLPILAWLNIRFLGRRPVERRESAALVWMAVSHLLFLVFVLQLTGHAQAPLYALPPLFALAVTPVPWREDAAAGRLPRILAVAGCAAAAAIAAGYAWRSHHKASHPDAEAREQKRLDDAVADALHAQGPRLVWEDVYNEHGWITAMTCFARHGTLPLPARLFTTREAGWRGGHPGKGPDEAAAWLHEQAVRGVDLLIVFDDPANAAGRFNNAFSEQVARAVAESVRRDSRWKKVFTLESAVFGPLAGYRNTSPHDSGYDRRLRGADADPASAAGRQ